MPVHPLQAVPGAPESALADAEAARLPAASAPAPWATVLDALVWWHRSAPGAREHLSAELRSRAALPLTIGALIRYRETPVGPYAEVLGSPVVLLELPLPAASVPFIAVDSAASVHGGRANWRLPKAFARFAWPETLAGAFEVRAEGTGWRVAARTSARPRGFPLALPLRTRQPAAGGGDVAFDARVRATARPATATIEVDGPTLPAWLLPGRHRAVVIEGARVRVGPAR